MLAIGRFNRLALVPQLSNKFAKGENSGTYVMHDDIQTKETKEQRKFNYATDSNNEVSGVPTRFVLK